MYQNAMQLLLYGLIATITAIIIMLILETVKRVLRKFIETYQQKNIFKG